jgi:hypothetical protein
MKESEIRVKEIEKREGRKDGSKLAISDHGSVDSPMIISGPSKFQRNTA